MTFTTTALEKDLEIAGPLKLVLFVSSTREDTDIFVKLEEQMPQMPTERAEGINPRSVNVTRGWLKASHRALDAMLSTPTEPVHTHDKAEMMEPGKVYRMEISLEPTAWLFKAGNRIRLEISNGDSAASEALWTHLYRPDKVGTDTFHFGPKTDAELLLPVLNAN
jgi:predicted acyl esterase